MGLFDGIGKKIAQTGQDTVNKAKSLAEIAKINGQITEEQRALTAFFAQIGEKYYKLYKDAPSGEFIQLCDRITASQIRIAELQTDVQRLRNTKLCPKCGAVCASNVQYCSSCGAQLPQPEPPAQPETQPEPEQCCDSQTDQCRDSQPEQDCDSQPEQGCDSQPEQNQ